MIILLSSQNLKGQLISGSADFVMPLSYKTHPAIDQLFVFYQKNEVFHPGELSASGPINGTFDFYWTKYDAESEGFSIALKNESNVETSTISGLNDGGYKVHISNGTDIDTSFIGWVMLDNFRVWTIKDDLGHVPYGESACPEGLNWIRVSGGVEIDDDFFYFDLQTHDTLWIVNDYDILWTSDNPDLSIPNKSNKQVVGGNYSESPPIKDTWYILTATDSLGMTEIDSVFYNTKFTKAKFSVEYWDKVVAQENPSEAWSTDLTAAWQNPNLDSKKGSLDAPLKVRFKNESENGYQYTWVLLDSTDDSGLNNKYFEDTYDFDYEPEYTYLTANKFYYPYLVSISDETCRDTFFLENGIEVAESQFEIPNVFSPNDDGINDYFVFKHQSIKEFRITIADRFGRVVYKAKVDDIYAWEGWRGTILNSDRQAPEGQYYYVIEGLGYDNREYRDPNYLEQRKLNKENGKGTSQPGTGTGTEGTTPGTNMYTGWIYLFRGFGQH